MKAMNGKMSDKIAPHDVHKKGIKEDFWSGDTTLTQTAPQDSIIFRIFC